MPGLEYGISFKGLILNIQDTIFTRKMTVAKQKYPSADFKLGDITKGIQDKADLCFTHKCLLHCESDTAVKNVSKIAPRLIMIEPITNRSGYTQEHIFYHNYLKIINGLSAYKVYPDDVEDTAILYR